MQTTTRKTSDSKIPSRALTKDEVTVRKMVKTAFDNGTKPVRIAEKASAFAKTELGQQLAYLNKIAKTTPSAVQSTATAEQIYRNGVQQKMARSSSVPHIAAHAKRTQSSSSSSSSNNLLQKGGVGE